MIFVTFELGNDLFSGVLCPDGWTLFEDSCYFLTKTFIPTFTAAVEFCGNMGSFLVEVSTYKIHLNMFFPGELSARKPICGEDGRKGYTFSL